MSGDVKYEIAEVLIDEESIQKRIGELAEEISADYAGEPLILVGILKGSIPFIGDLMKRMTLKNIKVDYMSVSSYGRSTKSSGVVRIIKDLDIELEGSHVLIVEDIIDTGLTLAYLKEYLIKHRPKSLKVCALLDKPSRRKVDIKGDYVGFEVEDKFIVGYGLDVDQRYRNLPFISWIKEEW